MNNENKRNFYEELKELWNEHKREIKIGAGCLFVGFCYGFIKGYKANDTVVGKALIDLIDKVPQLPAPDDIPIEEILQGCDKEEIMELMDF